MAIGDRIPTELISPQALGTSTATYFTNTSTSYRTQMPSLILNCTGATKRTVTLYKNGTAATNNFMTVVLDPTSNGAAAAVIEVPFVFTGTQTLGAKQDAGTDVVISAYGVVEQIA